MKGGVVLFFAISAGGIANPILSQDNAQSPRTAAGRGPTLRSRIVQALEKYEEAVRKEPGNGKLWWELGTHVQIAAGGSIEEEEYAAAMLQRAMVLEPNLALSYDHNMKIGDVFRGIGQAEPSRAHYTQAAWLEPKRSTQFVYAGLTLELEGNYRDAVRAYILANRLMAQSLVGPCQELGALAKHAAGCSYSSNSTRPRGADGGSTYLAYLAVAAVKSNDTRPARAYAGLLAPPRPRDVERPPAEAAAEEIRPCGLESQFLSGAVGAGASAAGGVIVGPLALPSLPWEGWQCHRDAGPVPGGWAGAVRRAGGQAFFSPKPSANPSESPFALLTAMKDTAMTASASAAAAAAAAKIREEVEALQFPGRCGGERRMLLYEYSQAFGFGAHAHMLTLALSVAHYTRRTLVPLRSNSWWLVDSSACDGRSGFDCFFEPMTNCTESSLTEPSVPFLQLGAEAMSATGGPQAVVFDWEAQSAAIKTGLLRNYCPPSVRHLGPAWWRAQAAGFLMRPLDWFEKEIQASMSRIGWKEPVVGLHIRHGDKLKESNRLPAQEYLSVANGVAQAIGANSIFVSTDSPDQLPRLAVLANASGSPRLVYEEQEIRGTDITNANLLNNLRLNVTRYAMEAARGVLLLSRASALDLLSAQADPTRMMMAAPTRDGDQISRQYDCWMRTHGVCTFSSNFGRLAYELMLARPPQPPAPRADTGDGDGDGHRRPAPGPPMAVSLDMPWFAYP